MNEHDDRREQLRLEIPEATTYAKTESWFNLISMYDGPGRLLDLSKSGAGFETVKKVEKDDLLRVRIDIPGEETLVLKGHVRWTAPVAWNGKLRVGIQFMPYGRRRQYNSPFALASLQVLQEKYEQALQEDANVSGEQA
jgi:hypothetical protein